jgi:hypothetical protein
MKSRPLEVQLFHADGRTDGQTDMTKQTDRHDKSNSGFSQFCERTSKHELLPTQSYYRE